MAVNDRLRRALKLWYYFFKVGWFTFGGGWNLVAQIQKDFVEDKHELKSEELLDIVSVGRSLPGTMIGNVAYLLGYHQCGALGGVFAVAGLILPSLIIIGVLTFCYTSFRDNVWVAKALFGVRTAVVPIIAVAASKLRKGAFAHPVCYLLCAGACCLSVFLNVSCILLVAGGVAAGLVLGMLYPQAPKEPSVNREEPK